MTKNSKHRPKARRFLKKPPEVPFSKLHYYRRKRRSGRNLFYEFVNLFQLKCHTVVTPALLIVASLVSYT